MTVNINNKALMTRTHCQNLLVDSTVVVVRWITYNRCKHVEKSLTGKNRLLPHTAGYISSFCDRPANLQCGLGVVCDIWHPIDFVFEYHIVSCNIMRLLNSG